jgi:(p)ppGpp synthase/HD superfamily hydrolase
MTSEPSGLPERGRLFSPLLEAAVRLASRGHYNQFRKSAGALQEAAPNSSLPKRVPYVAHLMGTMCILARVGVRDEVLAAAILHDYLEDVPDPNGREAIRTVVGDEVLDLVLEVTEHKRRGMDQSATWDLRKREQIEHIAVMPRDAVLIKGADVLHNLQSLITDLEITDDPDIVWGAFNADVDRQLWYFTNVAHAVAERLGDHPIQRALDTAIDRLRSLTDSEADAGLSRGRDRGP